MKIRPLIYAIVFVFLLSCGQNGERYYENDRLKYEVISVNKEQQILKEYNASGQVIAEFEMIDSVKHGVSKHFKNGQLDFKTLWDNDQQTVMIEDVSGNNQIQINHNFPDTLNSGDTVKAVFSSKNNNWQIVKAYAHCRIGSDGVFRIFKRTRVECLELPVRDKQALVQFVTVGKGNKVFDNITFVLQNTEGIEQATEMDFKYYLK